VEATPVGYGIPEPSIGPRLEPVDRQVKRLDEQGWVGAQDGVPIADGQKTTIFAEFGQDS
jgi:hypothetical protein